MLRVKVEQNGTIRCPICGNITNWSYILETMDPVNGMVPTCPNVKPHYKLVYPYYKPDGKVVFRVACETCGSVVETEPMDLIKE